MARDIRGGGTGIPYKGVPVIRRGRYSVGADDHAGATDTIGRWW